MTTQRKLIGFITVDDGRIAISDGCRAREGQYPELRWQGGSVIVGQFGGDGHFPVYIEREGGLVSRIIIVLDEEIGDLESID